MSKRVIKRFGLQINNPESIDIHELKMNPELREALKLNSEEKSYLDYLSEYIGTEEFNKILLLFYETLIASIPEEDKKKCRVCGLKTSENENEKLCTILQRMGGLNLLIASWELINLIENNRKIFKDNKQIKQLTRDFFVSFRFYQGKVYFELSEFKSSIIVEGLKNIKVILEEAPIMESLTIINESINVLKEEHIYYKLKNNCKNPYIKTQINWFREQERFYDKKALLKGNEQLHSKESDLNSTSDKNPHPHIFRDKQSFDFFEGLLEEFEIEDSKTQMADLTDIYILMSEDKLIYESFKPSDYIRWLHEYYEYISLDRLHPISHRKVPVKKRKIYINFKQSSYKTV